MVIHVWDWRHWLSPGDDLCSLGGYFIIEIPEPLEILSFNVSDQLLDDGAEKSVVGVG